MTFNTDTISKLINDENFQYLLSELQFRYECESKYENKNEYADVFNKFINKFFNVTDTHVTIKLRPFGFTINAPVDYINKMGTRTNVNSKISIGLKTDGTLVMKTQMV